MAALTDYNKIIRSYRSKKSGLPDLKFVASRFELKDRGIGGTVLTGSSSVFCGDADGIRTICSRQSQGCFGAGRNRAAVNDRAAVKLPAGRNGAERRVVAPICPGQCAAPGRGQTETAVTGFVRLLAGTDAEYGFVQPLADGSVGIVVEGDTSPNVPVSAM